ncbi:unnamed protein product, partial [Polarella glacialis]
MLRSRVRNLQGRIREIDRLKALRPSEVDKLQREKLDAEGEVRSSMAKLEAELALPPDPAKLIFEIQGAQGSHILEAMAGENCRDMARRFCEAHRLDPHLAVNLVKQLEQKMLQPAGSGGYAAARALPPGCKQPLVDRLHVARQTQKSIDLGDKDSVLRGVRALQKKIRDIEKLKLKPDMVLDPLQREKILTEAEARQSCAALERELDLMERLPQMVFDVETEQGTRNI